MHTSKTTSIKIKEILEIPLFISIIVVLEALFLVLPNVSLTPLLLAVYFSLRSYRKSFYLVIVYMAIEILQWGLGLWVLPMFLGWLIWSVVVKTGDKYLPYKGFVFAFIYGLAFMPLTVIVYNIDPWAYLVADFPFSLTLAVSNFVTLLWLYQPIKRLVKNYG